MDKFIQECQPDNRSIKRYWGQILFKVNNRKDEVNNVKKVQMILYKYRWWIFNFKKFFNILRYI